MFTKWEKNVFGIPVTSAGGMQTDCHKTINNWIIACETGIAIGEDPRETAKELLTQKTSL